MTERDSTLRGVLQALWEEVQRHEGDCPQSVVDARLREKVEAALAQPEPGPEQQLDIAATMMVAAFEKRPDLRDSFSVSLMDKISTECAGQVPAKATSGKRPPLATTPDPAHPPPAQCKDEAECINMPWCRIKGKCLKDEPMEKS